MKKQTTKNKGGVKWEVQGGALAFEGNRLVKEIKFDTTSPTPKDKGGEKAVRDEFEYENGKWVSTCKCHCHLVHGDNCRCIKNCIHYHPENFHAAPSPTPNHERWKKEFDARWSGEHVPVYQMFCMPDEKVGGGESRERIKDFISDLLAQIDQATLEFIEKNRKIEFTSVTDNDSHRYQIPENKREEWIKWCEIPSDDERSWETPSWAERIDGMPLTDIRPYNKALDDLKAYLTKGTP